MKRTVTACFVFVLVSLSWTLPSQETDESKQRDILRFGLEDEISALIQTFQNDSITAFNADLTELFKKTKSMAVRESIISLFTAQKNDSLKDFALLVLENPFDYKASLVQDVLSYAAEIKLADASSLIRKILESEQTQYRDRAILALGKIGKTEDAVYLFDYLDGEIAGDEKQRLIIRQNVMTSLGELKSVETWDRLVAIVQDNEENAVIRATAASAISKMEKAEAVPILAALYEDTDPILRTAAINGLGNFNTPDSVSVILESFKDSYYKVRLEAISAAQKNKFGEAVPYILYRAKNDPVENVKFKSLEALGSLNDGPSNSWLSSVFNDPKTVEKVRVKVASVLMLNNFDLIYPDVEKLMQQTLLDDKKTWLRYELGKIVAKTENQRTYAIASAYLAHKDTLTRNIGLDMYEKNKYGELRSTVEALAADEKQGALSRRAKKILDK